MTVQEFVKQEALLIFQHFGNNPIPEYESGEFNESEVPGLSPEHSGGTLYGAIREAKRMQAEAALEEE